jgi:formylglycine-generating enzyme required for sulfatase activity
MWESVMGANPSNKKAADLPVDSVSWDDVQEFFQRLNARKDGYHYRLPTEAEWEYAVRAGNRAARYGDLDSIAWYSENSGNETHTVGQKQPNAWGLYDMLGNVLEWVQDWCIRDYYQHSPSTDPAGPFYADSSKPCGYQMSHVVRGGSLLYDDIRVSHRGDLPSSYAFWFLGFRCVRVREAVK